MNNSEYRAFLRALRVSSAAGGAGEFLTQSTQRSQRFWMMGSVHFLNFSSRSLRLERSGRLGGIFTAKARRARRGQLQVKWCDLVALVRFGALFSVEIG